MDKTEENNIVSNKFSKRKIHNKYKLPCFINKKAKVYQKNGQFNIWTFCLKADDINKQFGIYANGLLVETISKQYINTIKINVI